MDRNRKKKQQGVQGVETGVRIAFALAAMRGAAPLRDLAKATHLSASKLHRYLVSLCRAGLLEQRDSDGLYDLGQGAIALGLAAQNRLDAFRLVDAVALKLFEATQLTVTVFAWGNRGPTVVRRMEPHNAFVVTTRIGSVISVLNSSAGRLFAAFLPDDIVTPIRDAEFAADAKSAASGKSIGRREFEAVVTKARTQRFASVSGDFLIGFDALGAPVFDAQGRMIMALVLIIPERSPQSRNVDAIRQLLKREAEAFSQRLGYRVN